MQGFKGIRGNFFLEVAKFHICSELGLVLNKGHRAGKKSSSLLSLLGQIQILGKFISSTATGEMGSDEPMQN